MQLTAVCRIKSDCLSVLRYNR